MSKYDGIEYNDISIGKLMGKNVYSVSRDDIEQYIRNTGIAKEKFIFDEKLIVPPAMIFVFTLRSIFSNDIPLDGAILAGHELKCFEPIQENDNMHVEVVIKDKYVRNDKKYVLIDFIIQGDDNKIRFINTMRAIWPQ